MKVCQYCGKQIRWEKTKAGKYMPCNAGAVYYVPDEQGEMYVLDGQGEIVRAHRNQGNERPVRVGSIPHFMTCPNLPPRARATAQVVTKAEVKTKKEEPKAAQKVEQLKLWPDRDLDRWRR